MGVVHRPSPDWASHMPVLIKALELTDGHVLELGMGMFSTPLLHALCEVGGRDLVSYDNDERYIDMFKKFKTPSHQIHFVEDWAKLDISGISWRVVLVDQKPAEARRKSIEQLADPSDAIFVIIHDSNDPAYDYESVYPLFKYRYDHKYLQHTTVLSNKDDVKHIFRNSVDK